MSKKPDRRGASTEVRLELRRQMQRLREQGKTIVEIAAITGYTRSYVSTLLTRMAERPEMLAGMWRVGDQRAACERCRRRKNDVRSN